MQLTKRQGLFGGNNGGNLPSNIFDGSACIVSSIIGGGDPRCRGNGAGTGTGTGTGNQGPGYTSQSSSDYNYTYNTNDDGSLKVTITTNGGKTCTYNLQADGRNVNDVAAEAAQKCQAQSK